MKAVTETVINIGVKDLDIGFFERQYPVPNGIAYNSYLILDEKVTVFDTVDERFCNDWLLNLDEALAGRDVDYLVITHMEPDHSGSVDKFINKYPNAVIVSNGKSFNMIENFFGSFDTLSKIEVKEGDILSTGKHTFNFYAAPMVHWPEVIVAYDSYSKILFSADAFGTFGVYDDGQTPEQWQGEAARYYFGIVGKYGPQVQALLRKVSTLDISAICSLHGPVIDENLDKYIEYYDIWSSYEREKDGVFIGYSTIYGNTEKAALLFQQKLIAEGCGEVVVFEIKPENISEAVANAFRYGKIVLASPTYNASIYPFMHNFIHALTERNFQNKFIGFIENTSWAPNAIKTMTSMLEKCKNIEFADNNVSIKGAVDSGEDLLLDKLAAEVANRS